MSNNNVTLHPFVAPGGADGYRVEFRRTTVGSVVLRRPGEWELWLLRPVDSCDAPDAVILHPLTKHEAAGRLVGLYLAKRTV